jgi:hypothetical protein
MWRRNTPASPLPSPVAIAAAMERRGEGEQGSSSGQNRTSRNWGNLEFRFNGHPNDQTGFAIFFFCETQTHLQ